jgi:hypothetical protein
MKKVKAKALTFFVSQSVQARLQMLEETKKKTRLSEFAFCIFKIAERESAVVAKRRQQSLKTVLSKDLSSLILLHFQDCKQQPAAAPKRRQQSLPRNIFTRSGRSFVSYFKHQIRISRKFSS